jgi:hypothetical protein
MNWLSVGVVLGAALLYGSEAMATSTESQSVIARRQLSACMTKQMQASRTLSYNEATKLCKERLKSQTDGLTARNEGKPANAR